ncbi:MAG: hypothetical protein M1818_007931 [Claussenomyces sp. TS43310]|nr:MAG: hypothetical protein M1818_007931 [Claussenomyces sp. TS43310]
MGSNGTDARERVDAWAGPGRAAFDFRKRNDTHTGDSLGDTQTSPTASMLTAIQNTTLGDDVYREDATTNDLEAYIAKLTSHEKGLFVLSGTMGNQLALRSHLTQPPHSVLCDHRAHILEWEAGGVATLSGAMVRGIVPQNGSYLTLEDIQAHIVLSDDVHACPTRVISLENTLGGTIQPLAETQRIAAFGHAHGVKLHLDGARLWEAVAAGAGSLNAYARCFDSVTVCFSKGLGAPVGSMLVGGESFIKHARWMRKAIGGGLRQPGVVTAAARVAVDETFGRGPNGEGGLLSRSHAVANRIAASWVALGGTLDKPTETNMVWLNLANSGCSNGEFAALGTERGLIMKSGRLVVHYQISEEAVARLEDVMRVIMERKGSAAVKKPEGRICEKSYG